MKTVQLGKTPTGYLVIDARSAPRDTASVAPSFAVRSEAELRTALQRFGLTEQAIDAAVQEVNQTGQASVPVGA